jgi:hypothetical protein
MFPSLRRPRTVLSLLLGCALLAPAGYLLSGARHLPPVPSAAVAVAAQSPVAPARAPAAATGHRARYRLDVERHATIDGREAASQRLAGTWTTTERAEGRVEAQLAASRLEMVGEKAPTPAEAAAPFVLVTDDGGSLHLVGFAEGTSPVAKNVLSSLAATLQYTLRPGDAWTVEEEDLTGRYQAHYTRSGDRVLRTRDGYTRTHEGAEQPAQALASDEHSELLVDARGLVSATVRLEQTVRVGPHLPTVHTSSRAVLTRVDSAEVALVAGPDLTLEPLTSRVDHAAQEHRRAERLVAGASADTLLDAAAAVAHLDAKAPDSSKARATALRRLAAVSELDDGAPAKVAEAIRRDPGDEPMVDLLAGALSSSHAPAATNALSALLAEDLPAGTRDQIQMQLALAAAPTAESAAALAGQLDGPQHGTAALALGAQAGKLGEDGAGGEAIDQLLARHAGATSQDEKILYLQALANTKSRLALPVMEDAIHGRDFALACAGTTGLRFIPGDDVDDLLEALIEHGTVVTAQAIAATAYRSPALWQPRLVAAQKLFKGHKRALDAIDAVLVHWADLSVPSKL